MSTLIPSYLCPSDRGDERGAIANTGVYYTANGQRHTNYALCAGDLGGSPWEANWQRYSANRGNLPDGRTGIPRRGAFGHNSAAKFRDFLDGTSNVVIVGEVTITNRTSTSYEPIWGGHRHVGTFFKTAMNANPNHNNNYRYHINGPACTLGATGLPPAWPCNNAALLDTHYWGVTASLHPGGAQYTLGDGSVRFVAETIDKNLWAIVTRLASGQADTL